MERYEEAITVLKKALHYQPDFVVAHVRLSFCYAALGREEEASAMAAEFVTMAPGFSVKRFEMRSPFKNPADTALLAGTMRKIGLPD